MKTVFVESLSVYGKLLKVMIPALLIVKILQEFGGIDILGTVLSPVMTLVGLPDLLGVVWATALLTNVFTGVLVFFQIAGDISLSVEQMTVLGVLLLIGHSIPVEGAVARRAGVPWWVTILLRVGGAIILACILHVVYTGIPAFQETAQIVWRPVAVDDSLLSWAIGQVKSLWSVFWIIVALIVLMKVLRRLGLEKLMHVALTPLLRILGIGRSAANVTVIGVTLGLSYGAGLLIRDLDNGVMSRRDGYLALCFLGLVHSLIEDTLLIMALGADLSGILLARICFAVPVIALLARLLPSTSSTTMMN